MLSDGMAWPRLALLAAASIITLCVVLVLAHGLWERASGQDDRHSVVLFNPDSTAGNVVDLADGDDGAAIYSSGARVNGAGGNDVIHAAGSAGGPSPTCPSPRRSLHKTSCSRKRPATCAA